MKRYLPIICFFSFPIYLYAQQDAVAVKYAQIISPELAEKHLSIIASDAYEGRETGKPGADKAAHYIADEFKALGLQPIVNGSYFLDVPLVENIFTTSSFVVNGVAYTSGKDFYSISPAGTKTVSATDIVFIGYGIGADNYDDLAGVDISGKVVLFINDGEPGSHGVSKITGNYKKSDWSTNRAKRIQFLQSKNPALILAASPMVAANIKRFGTNITAGRLSIKKEDAVKKPEPAAVYYITTDVADNLLKKLGKTYTQLKAAIDESGTPQTQVVKTDFSVTFNSGLKDVKAVDVLGYMPGSDPKLKDEVLVISAHYDHIGYAARKYKGRPY